MFHLESINQKRVVNLLLRFTSLNWRGVYLAKGTKLYADVFIATGTRINGSAVIKGHGVAHIGKYCAIGDGLRLITSNHCLQQLALQNMLLQQVAGGSAAGLKRDVTIGHDVWVGDSVMIMPGVKIGNGAVIGAGSVVTRPVEPYEVVAGNPARKIGERFPASVVELLQKLQWWEWKPERMKAARGLFSPDFAALTEEKMLARIRSEMELPES